MKIQLRHLHYFVAVAEELNFHRASDRVFVSQPTLSHQIAQLEDILGVKLLIRDKRHVKLTTAGKLLYEKSLMILNTVEVSIAQVKDLGIEKPLKIGIPSYHTFDIVSMMLHKFTLKYPDVAVEIQEMTAVEMNDSLHRRKLDLGFLALPFPPPGNELLNVKLIDKEPYLFCLSKQHPNSGLSVLNAEVLKNTKFILLPREYHPTFHDFILKKLCDIGVEPDVLIEVTSAQAQYSLAAAEMGVCLALDSSPIPDNNLTVLPLDPPVLQHELTIASHKDNQREEVQNFLSCVEALVES